MASIILGAAGAAASGAIAPVFGSAVGKALGESLGGIVDQTLFGSPTRHTEGSRLADLSVQVSTYGKMIPSVYGTMRIAGNIIWSTPIKETRTTTSARSGGGKGAGGGGAKTTNTTYSYTVSLAIALCMGEISEMLRVWADAKLLDRTQGTYRLYKGDEAQLPDPLMEAVEGMGNVPAYRGLAYLVIEDFPLGDFGNRIPNFTFEVKRSLNVPDYQGQTTEEMVTAITLIPGAGEFVYDTVRQTKVQGERVGAGFAQAAFKQPINYHTPEAGTNASVALDQLARTCPHLEWVSVVVTWFGDSLDAGICTILPAVEYSDGAITEPSLWSVAGYDRATARAMTIVDGSPRYGGTPDDGSVVRLIADLRARGYKIMFYPLFFMDVENKPWRGRVSGSASDVAAFFTKSHGYNAFITHYANLVKDKVDAFVIGSELIGLTKVSSGVGVYPAVNALVSLAATVRSIMGTGIKLTYAADWSEYHHSDGGWYNLDPLWASANIDMIGIDAYFPLTNAPQTQLGYGIDAVIQGWNSGEGHEYYYTDETRTITAPLSAAYAWKNLEWFWSNAHVNPNGVPTAWVPESKKLWFCEFGFPSVDGATNQPNVFYDPTSAESFFPRFSKGMVDIRAQRTGITGTLARWKNSAMVEQLFLWTWDARPYPYFPDLRSVWADGGVWATGHWVTGKFGVSGLAAIVRDLCLQAGLNDAQIDVSRLSDRVEGYAVTRRATARSYLEELMSAYFFDAVERKGVLHFLPRTGSVVASIPASNLVPHEVGKLLGKLRTPEAELPKSVEVLTLDRTRNYQTTTRRAMRQGTSSQLIQTFSLPLVMSGAQAEALANKQLYLGWLERTRYSFVLDMAHSALEPTDTVTLLEDGVSQKVRITHIAQEQGQLHVVAVAEDITLLDAVAEVETPDETAITTLPSTLLTLLDLPAFPNDAPNDAFLRIACAGEGEGWNGAAMYRADGDGDYIRMVDTNDACVMGTVTLASHDFTGGNRVDEVSTFEVILIGDGALQSVTNASLLNGANVALVGSEVLQFRDAILISPHKYRISGLLRGRLGTEGMMVSHNVGERFILLNESIAQLPVAIGSLGLSRNYKAVSIGATLASAASVSFIYCGKALMPYAPVHGNINGVVGSDITLTWIRRDRLYGQWRDYVDAGLSEVSEAYEIEIWNGSLKLRTLFSTSPTVMYTVAAQIEDGIFTNTSLAFFVMQISALAGRGSSLKIMSA